MSMGYANPEETGEILWITAPLYSKQRQRTSRPCSIAPIKRPQSQERHAPIKLTYFTYTQAKDKIVVNDMTNISTPQE